MTFSQFLNIIWLTEKIELILYTFTNQIAARKEDGQMSSFHNEKFDKWLEDLIDNYKKDYPRLSVDKNNFIRNTREILELYEKKKDNIENFGVKVLKTFQAEEKLKLKIHSFGFRLKENLHLAEKLIRKKIENPHIDITRENLFSEITDLAGLRILQLYKTDIKEIHHFICNSDHWNLSKPPVAYNFSPRFLKIFKELDIEVQEKATGYSSAHYLVHHPKFKNCQCEIQVRTLFEEGWSEIDHTFNYPKGQPGKICKSLLETLKRVCDVAVYIADQIPEIYDVEKNHQDRVEDLGFSMGLLQNNIIKNLQAELDELKDKINPPPDNDLTIIL